MLLFPSELLADVKYCVVFKGPILQLIHCVREEDKRLLLIDYSLQVRDILSFAVQMLHKKYFILHHLFLS